MGTLPYERAFDRIRAEYREMPGMRLTPERVQRLCGVELAVCRHVFADLARAAFVSARSDGSYCRAGAAPSAENPDA
jgi:hypothetical protein